MITLVDVRLDHPRSGAAIVSDASLDIARGETVVIVGEPGVATARLVAAILGEITPRAGRVEIWGRDVAKLRRASLRLMRRRIGIVPQELCLLDERTAQDNVMLPLEVDGLPRMQNVARANELLAMVGLSDAAAVVVAELDPAQRQRVAVARALVRKPEIIIADHPTSLQDKAGAALVLDAFAATGSTVLVFSATAPERDWRTFAIDSGALRELLPEPEITSIPNIVPFPISARTAGVA